MSDYTPKVLVVEDEAEMRSFLTTLLDSHDYVAVAAEDGTEGLRLATQHNPDVILLDLGLPDMTGLELLRKIREWTQTPVIILSVRDREDQKVEALDEGADDYLTKPFGSNELLARVRVSLRHVAQRDTEDDSRLFETGDLTVDLADRRVFVREERISLTDTEYRLLRTMIRHAGKVLTHRFLLKEVWGPNYVDRNHYVRVYMARLRDKLEDEDTRQQYIETETGVGYRLREASS
jgi:two-component system KDP operon response regulator KdpE